MFRKFFIALIVILNLSIMSTAVAGTVVKTTERDAGYNLDSFPGYSANSPLSFSWINISGISSSAVITSLKIKWNADANNFNGVRAFLAWRYLGEVKWVSNKFDIKQTDDDDDELDLYSATSEDAISFYPPESVKVNGSWELYIEDSHDDDNPLADVGRIDWWEIEINYESPQYDLVGAVCDVPDILSWGEVFILVGRVRNDGRVGSVQREFVQEFYLSNDQRWGDEDDIKIATFHHSGNIEPRMNGPEFRVTVQLPDRPPEGYEGPGPFYVGMKTDANSSTDPSVAENNGPGAFNIGIDWDKFELPTLSIGNSQVIEGNSETTAKIFVTMSRPLNHEVNVGYFTSDGAYGAIATAGHDYVPIREGLLTFEPNQTTKEIDVKIKGDRFPEPNETFRVHLYDSDSIYIKNAIGIATIENDDGSNVPKVYVNNSIVWEGDSGNTNAVFSLQVVPASDQEIKLRYKTSDDTAVSGSDYVGTKYDKEIVLHQLKRKKGKQDPLEGFLERIQKEDGGHSLSRSPFASPWLPIKSADSISIPVIGDTLVEADEFFNLEIVGASNAEIATARSFGFIRNDDLPIVSIQNSTSLTEEPHWSISEEAGQKWTPTSIAACDIRLSAMSNDEIVVFWRTEDGNAIANSDYIANSGRVVFSPNETNLTRTIQIEIINDDDMSESDEIFYVVLSPEANNANVDNANARCQITIRNFPQ